MKATWRSGTAGVALLLSVGVNHVGSAPDVAEARSSRPAPAFCLPPWHQGRWSKPPAVAHGDLHRPGSTGRDLIYLCKQWGQQQVLWRHGLWWRAAGCRGGCVQWFVGCTASNSLRKAAEEVSYKRASSIWLNQQPFINPSCFCQAVICLTMLGLARLPQGAYACPLVLFALLLRLNFSKAAYT